MFNGIYKFPSYHFTCTNRLHQQGAHRRLPRPPGVRRRHLPSKRMMDELAAELSRDPLDLRAPKTGSPTRSSPSTPSRVLTYDSGNYEAATATGRGSCSTTTGFAARGKPKRRERQDPVQLGIGISTFTEMCGLAPSRNARRRWPTGRAAGSMPRSACCQPARWRWSPARRRTVQGQRDGVEPKSSRTNSESRSTTSRSCTATLKLRRAAMDTYGVPITGGRCDRGGQGGRTR